MNLNLVGAKKLRPHAFSLEPGETGSDFDVRAAVDFADFVSCPITPAREGAGILPFARATSERVFPEALGEGLTTVRGLLILRWRVRLAQGKFNPACASSGGSATEIRMEDRRSDCYVDCFGDANDRSGC